MDNSVSIVLIGIGGYGDMYLQKMLDEGEQLNARLAGVVDIQPRKK